MPNVDGIVSDIRNAQSLFKNRKKSGGDHGSTDELEARLSEKITRKLKNLPYVDTPGGDTLYAAVGDSGFSDTCKQLIINAIDALLLADPDDDESAAGAKTCQKWIKVEAWAPQYLIDTLNDPSKSLGSKQQAVADFLTLGGITSCHEQTRKWWLAAILACHFKRGWPTYNSIYNTMEEFKAMIVASKKKWPFHKIKDYGADPESMPTNVYKHIYADGGPAGVKIPRLAEIANHHIPLRSNSKLIINENKRKAAGDRSYYGPRRCDESSAAETRESEPAWAVRLQNRLSRIDTNAHEQIQSSGSRVEIAPAASKVVLPTVDEGEVVPAWAKQLCLRMDKLESTENIQPEPERVGKAALQSKLGLRANKNIRLLASDSKDGPAGDVPADDVKDKASGGTEPSSAKNTKDMTTEELEAYVLEQMKSVEERRKELREEKRKAQQAAKAKEKADKLAAKGGAGGGPKATAKAKAKAVLKKPASATDSKKRKAGSDAIEWTKKTKPPLPPENDTTVVHYNGGTIFKYPLKKIYRFIRERGVYKTELQRRWKDCRKTAWLDGIKAIDDFQKKRK